MMTSRYSTISQLPEGIWDQFIARGNISLDSRLIALAEESYPDADFFYFVLEDHGLRGLFFMMVQPDLIEDIDLERHIYGFTATPESSGWHLYWDDTYLDFGQFIDWALLQIKQFAPQVELLLIQDIIEGSLGYSLISEPIEMERITLMEVSHIAIPQPETTLDDYMATLPSKSRNEWRKAMSALDRARYKIEARTDYVAILGQLYPLYLSVAARAGEYLASPHPVRFFEQASALLGQDATAITIYDRDEQQYIGFMLLLFSGRSCLHYYIGFEPNPSLYLWHNLTIESFREGFRRGCTHIDMGVTNAVGKRKFGASTIGVHGLLVRL